GHEVAKILDFGIAKMGDSGGAKLTQTGMVFGTPHYMSPEQAMGHALDARSDIYAVGVILYELFTGVVTVSGHSCLAIFTQLMTAEPVRPSQASVRPVPEAIERVILRAMAKKPEARYQSMEALGRELDAIRQNLGPPSVNESAPPPRKRRWPLVVTAA